MRARLAKGEQKKLRQAAMAKAAEDRERQRVERRAVLSKLGRQAEHVIREQSMRGRDLSTPSFKEGS